MLAFADPSTPAAAEAVARIRGPCRVVLLTGEGCVAATAIAREVGLLGREPDDEEEAGGHKVVSAPEIRGEKGAAGAMALGAWRAVLAPEGGEEERGGVASVVCRASPEDRVRGVGEESLFPKGRKETTLLLADLYLTLPQTNTKTYRCRRWRRCRAAGTCVR